MENQTEQAGNHACPYCQKPVADDARLCVHCGGPLMHTGDAVKNPNCPRCRKELSIIQVEGGDTAEVCQACKGLWLDLEEFKRTANPQRIPKEYSESKYSWFKPNMESVQYISCPRCGRLMNRENFSQISGIIIDRCRDHGVWLDAGELDRIRLFIGQGGLERIQDLRLNKLEVNVQTLAHKTRELDFITQLLHSWNFKRFIFQGRGSR